MGPDTIIARTALLPEGRQKFNVGAEIYGKAKMFVVLSNFPSLSTIADLNLTGPGSQRSPRLSKPSHRHRRTLVRLEQALGNLGGVNNNEQYDLNVEHSLSLKQKGEVLEA